MPSARQLRLMIAGSGLGALGVSAGVLFMFVLPCFCSLIKGCSPGYQQVEGEWSWVYWNEAVGRGVNKLDADNETFEVLNERRFEWRHSEYARDRVTVFYRGERLLDADPATFEVLSDPIYARDVSHVFLFGHPVTGADPATFTILRPPYAKDALRAYCGTVPMNVDNLDAFEPVLCGGGWGIAYAKGRDLQRDEYADLEVSRDRPAATGEGWARDGVSYYHRHLKVNGADYGSFRVLDVHRAVDNQGRWYGSQPYEKYVEQVRLTNKADVADRLLRYEEAQWGRAESK